MDHAVEPRPHSEESSEVFRDNHATATPIVAAAPPAAPYPLTAELSNPSTASSTMAVSVWTFTAPASFRNIAFGLSEDQMLDKLAGDSIEPKNGTELPSCPDPPQNLSK